MECGCEPGADGRRLPAGGTVSPGNLASRRRQRPGWPRSLAVARTWEYRGTHPFDPDSSANHATLWAGSVGGGIWRTDNGGQSWAPVDDFMANLAVTSMVMDPQNPNLIYAATGEGFGNLDALRGGGIFRTTDGVNWAQVPLTTGAGWDRINRLAVSADGVILLAATNAGSGAASIPPAQFGRPCYRTPWQTLTLSVASAAGGGRQHFKRKGLFTIDGGATWTSAVHAGFGVGASSFAMREAHRHRICVDRYDSGEIWRSTNGGRSFTRRQSRNPDGDRAAYLGDQGWYDNVIWAGDPTNANLAIVGGVDLRRSTDGGDNLVDISTWWDPRSAHAHHHAIVVHPAYDGSENRTVFFGTMAGFIGQTTSLPSATIYSLPRISGWTELNNTYAVTQFYGGAGHAGTGIIGGGAQDNGSLAYNPAAGPETWHPFLRRGRRFLLL